MRHASFLPLCCAFGVVWHGCYPASCPTYVPPSQPQTVKQFDCDVCVLWPPSAPTGLFFARGPRVYARTGLRLPGCCAAPGGYCPIGSSSPLSCPEGTFNNATGAYDVSFCVDCLPVWYTFVVKSTTVPMLT